MKATSISAPLALLAVLATGAPLAAQAGDAGARPCDAIEAHREFDFWLGEWDVVAADGRRLGVNSITRPEQECMLVERWEAANGSRGTSINYFDPATGHWVQYWVTASSLLDLEGGMADGSMRMEGMSRQLANPDASSRTRGTWTPLDDGRVRQVFETWDGDEETWRVVFEGYYVRKDATEGRQG